MTQRKLGDWFRIGFEPLFADFTQSGSWFAVYALLEVRALVESSHLFQRRAANLPSERGLAGALIGPASTAAILLKQRQLSFFVNYRYQHALPLRRCMCRASHLPPRVQSCSIACVGVLLDSSSQLQLLIFMGLNAAGVFVVARLKPFANRYGNKRSACLHHVRLEV